MIRELLDGLKSRLKGVGEKGMPLPPPGGLPPVPLEPLQGSSTPQANPPTGAQTAPATEDFSTLLGGGDTTELDNKVKALEEKTSKLESQIKETLDITKANKSRLDSIDVNMKKFISLYELVTNQINPFVDSKPFKKADRLEAAAKKLAEEKEEQAEDKIVMPSAEELEKGQKKEAPKEAPAPKPAPAVAEPQKPEPEAESPMPEQPKPAAINDDEQVMFMQSVKDGSASFVLEWITSLVAEDGGLEKNTKLLRYLLQLGWITPKAYEALMRHVQGLAQVGKVPQQQRIPLMVGMPSNMQGFPATNMPSGRPMQIPNMPMTAPGNMDNLATVLEWVKYLVDKTGSNEAAEILKYLVQLEWITPEAHSALLSYIQNSTPPGALSMPGAAMEEERTQRSQQKRNARFSLQPNQIPSPAEFMQNDMAQFRIPIQSTEQQPSPMQSYYQPLPYREPQRDYYPQPKRREERKPQTNAIIPLTDIGSDIDSLAIVLEWIRYLVDRAGTQGAKDIFGYYQNIGWIDQRVNQQLVKYVDGIKAQEVETVGYQPSVEDHATSLFFISKLKHMDLSEDDINNMLGK